MIHRILVPGLFVVLWSTGYVVVRLTMPDAGPVRFLAWRFGAQGLAAANERH